MKFFRRKSISEAELQNDYPTNSDPDDFTDDERRRQEWQQHLNRRATVANVGQYANTDEEQWEYESEYNYSVGSETSIIDAYKERRVPDSARYYSERDLERRIEHAMRNEFIAAADDGRRKKSSVPSTEDRRKSSYQNDDIRDTRELNRRQSLFPSGDGKRDRFNVGDITRSPVTERVRQFEQCQGKRRTSQAPASRFRTLPFRRDSGDDNSTPWTTFGKKKVRKQLKQRKRARNVSDFSDEEDDKKFSVNLTMEDLNDIIKKNVNSAVKTLTSGKNKPRIPRSDSFSTETETIFSGSSSHSTEIPTGLLKKQMKAQLDKDQLRGIIKNAVAKEASDVLQKSLNVSTPSPIIPIINEIPPSPQLFHPHYGSQQHSASQYVASPQLPTARIPPAPPPPPPLPSAVTFNLPGGVHSTGMNMYSHGDALTLQHNRFRRNSVSSAQGGFNSSYDDNFNNCHIQPDQNFENCLLGDGIPQASFNRLQNRRHTLAAIDPISDISSLTGDRMENFSNALKLLDKTIKQAENSACAKSKEEDEKDSVKNDSNKSEDDKPASSDTIAPLPVGVLTPFQSIADQIAALSKKKETPLEIGQIPMSVCARTFLILSNIIFLIVGGGLSGVGVWMMTDPKIETYFDILNVDKTSSSFKMICYAMLAVGIFALLVAFLGCCGAIQKSKCLLTLFLILVGVITVLEAGLGVVIVLSKDSATAIPVLSALMSDMQEKLRTQLKLSLTEYYLPDTLLGTTWDTVQIELECCGATGPGDYKYSRWRNETRPETDYPDTCCVLMSKDADVPEPSNKLLCHFGTAGFYFETGCYKKMVGWFQDNSMYIITSAGAVFVIEIVGFISAFVICKNGVKKKSKEAEQQTDK